MDGLCAKMFLLKMKHILRKRRRSLLKTLPTCLFVAFSAYQNNRRPKIQNSWWCCKQNLSSSLKFCWHARGSESVKTKSHSKRTFWFKIQIRENFCPDQTERISTLIMSPDWRRSGQMTIGNRRCMTKIRRCRFSPLQSVQLRLQYRIKNALKIAQLSSSDLFLHFYIFHYCSFCCPTWLLSFLFLWWHLRGSAAFHEFECVSVCSERVNKSTRGVT